MNRLYFLAALLLLACVGCGGSAGSSPEIDQNSAARFEAPLSPAVWPSALPQDAPQPWEQLDSNGYVLPIGRGSSAINTDSEFVSGVERYADGGDATDNGEATRLGSTAGNLGYAIYRIPLGGAEVGVVNVDANLTAGKGYYVGLADYSKGAWEWHGPFVDNHIRLSTWESDFTSPLGSVFICVLVHDGAACDVIGIGVNPVDSADTTPPPTPGAPSVTPVNGGLLLEWLPVAAGDLAGYRIYHNTQWFLDGHGTGVQVVDQLEGLSSFMLHVSAETYVRISAVDISGNESALSGPVSGAPLTGTSTDVRFTVSAPSGSLNDTVTIIASGAEIYDFDVDGDGIFDITGTASASQNVVTSSLGMIRPRVRAFEGGVLTAQGGVSVIISGNSRPVASAIAVPQSGDAPLNVAFSGADSTDFDGAIVGGGWDFDGDGTYDVWEPADVEPVEGAQHMYTVPGVYNAKLRVVDDAGAWDVDTVAIVVTGSNPNNELPIADLAIDASVGEPPFVVRFDASGSADPDGEIVSYDWDWDGNGGFDESTYEPIVLHAFHFPGSFNVRLRVKDDAGGTALASTVITSHGWIHHPDPDPTAESGQFRALAEIAGRPALAYNNGVNSAALAYVIAKDANGTAWNDPVVIEEGGSVLGLLSMLEVNGRPAIAYNVATDNKLRYIRADDPMGSSWPTEGLILDSTSGAGLYTSMAIVDGAPAVAYYTSSTQELRYIRAANADGTSWNPLSILDSNGNTGLSPSMAVINGTPAIAYRDFGNSTMRFIRATNAQGTAWDTIRTPDTTGHDVGSYLSMCATVNFAAIAYLDSTDGRLMYIRSSNGSASAWTAPVVLDEGSGADGITILKLGSSLRIAYYNYVFRDLKFVESFSHFGSDWNAPITLAAEGFTGSWNCMAVINGDLAISYEESSQRPLRYIKRY